MPSVTDVQPAIADGAPLLHDAMTTTDLGEPTDKHSKIATHFSYELGGLEQGFERADVVVERKFTTTMVHLSGLGSPFLGEPKGHHPHKGLLCSTA